MGINLGYNGDNGYTMGYWWENHKIIMGNYGITGRNHFINHWLMGWKKGVSEVIFGVPQVARTVAILSHGHPWLGRGGTGSTPILGTHWNMKQQTCYPLEIW